MSLHAVDTGQSLPPLIDVVGDFDASANTFSRDSGGTITGLKQGMVITITNAADSGNNTNYTLTADASTTLALGSVAADESNDTITITPIIGHNTPTNPTLVEINSTALAGDINCFEIYKTRGAAPANTLNGVSSSTVNRLYPASTTIDSHQSAKSTTPGYKIHSDVTLTNILSGSSLDTNNDYFVLVYSDNGNKHHFAKITEVLNYDTAGDGFEFEPRLKEDIPKGTKFAVFKGPSSTNTDLVAVSYGLTGTGDKHNHHVNVSRPTFYFYNDRIDNPIDNELAHNTKYEVRKSRYDGSSHVHSSTCFLTNQSFGPRLLDKSPYKHTVKIVDTAHTNDSTVSATTTTHYTNYAGSAQTYTANLTSWDACFLNASRPVYTLSGGLASGSQSVATVYSGPSTHLSFVESPEITKLLENVASVKVSKTVTVSGNYSELEIYDFEKILDEKIKMNDDFKVRSVLYDQKFASNYDVNLPGKVHTNSNAGELEFRELGDEQDLARLLGDGETIRIDNYIYVVASVASKSSGTQVVTIDAFKTREAATFTAGTTIHDTLAGVKAFRRAWSTLKSNLLTNAKIDTDIASDGSMTKNGITVSTSQVDYRDLNVVFDDNDLKSFRVSVNKGDKNNQYFELNDTALNVYQYGNENRGTSTVTSNSVKYIAPIINYISGGAFIDNIIFDGTVEYIKSETQSTQMKYTISGRDDLGKLLSKVNNKKYLYSDEYVYSTESPIGTPTYTGMALDVGSTYTMGQTSYTVDVASGSASGQIFTGDLIYYKDNSSGTDRYIFLGISTTTISSSGTLNLLYETTADINVSSSFSAITNYGSVKLTTDLASSEIKLYARRGMISTGKSLSTDIADTTTPTTLKGSADKGINFLSGKVIDPTDGSTSSSLVGSKATGYTGRDADNSLGYSISNTLELETDKISPEGFTVYQSDESTVERLTTVSSMSEYEIVNMEEVDNGLNRITVAPLMPVVLGRIDSNSSNTKSITNSQGIYLVNRNGLPQGGFIHLLNSETDSGLPISFMGKLLGDDETATTVYANYIHRFGSPIWRYIDLETGEPGSIYFNDEISNRLTGASKNEVFGLDGLDLYKGDVGRFMAHATIVRTDGSGTYVVGFDNSITNTYLKEGPHESRGPMPAVGSNFYDMTIVPTELSAARDTTDVDTIFERHWGLRLRPRTEDSLERFEVDKFFFEANDPKISNLFLFSVGDTLPDSKKRLTHIGGAADRNFSDYSIILKTEGESIQGQSHQKYKGALQSKELNDDNFAIAPINASSITPNNINRFGLIRLVELTMDWHFNVVDTENLTDNDNYRNVINSLNKKYKLNPLLSRAHDVDTLRSYGATALSSVDAQEKIHSAAVSKTSGDGQPNFVITSGTNLRVPANYSSTSFVRYSGTSHFITTTNTSFGVSDFSADGTHVNGMYLQCTTTGDITKIIEVSVDGSSRLQFTIEGFPNNRSATTANYSYRILPIEVWTSPYNANGSKYIGQIASFNSGTNTVTLTSNANTDNFSELSEVFFCFNDTTTNAYKFNNNILNYNRHLVSGNMLEPYSMVSFENLQHPTASTFDQVYEYNCELLPNQLIPPINFNSVLTYAEQEMEFPNETNSIYCDPYFSMMRSSSRIMNDMIMDIEDFNTYVEIVNGSNNRSPNRRAYSGGTEVFYGSNDVASGHGSSSGSKLRNNLIGVITRDYEPFAFGVPVPKLIDAVSARELVSGFSSFDHNVKYTDYITHSTPGLSTSTFVFDGDTSGAGDITTPSTDARDILVNDGDGVYRLFSANTSGSAPYPKSSTHTVSWLGNRGDLSDSGTVAFESVLPMTTIGTDIDYDSANLNILEYDAFGHVTPAKNWKVTAGMTFPVIGNTYPRGNLNSNYFATYYGPAYTSGYSSATPPVLLFDKSHANVKKDDYEMGTGENVSMFNLTDTIIENNVNRTNIRGAEVFYKPVLNFTGPDISLGKIYASVDGQKRARFSVKIFNTRSDTYVNATDSELDNAQTASTQQNRWIHFAPNLTGYYLVSEVGTSISTNSSVSNRNINNSIPTNIFKVISHTIKKGISTVTEGGHTFEFFEHIIDIDNVSGTIGNNVSISGYFRVMRPSQDALYDFTPTDIDLLTLSSKYTKQPYVNQCYTTINKFNKYNGEYDTTASAFSEGVLSMFIPIEVDSRNNNNYVDVRTISEFITSTETNNMLVTDGHNKLNTNVTLTAKTSPTRVTLSMASMRKMHGCVSFGETFTIDLFNKPKIRSTRCSIGTHVQIVDEAEKVINDLIENTDVTYTQTNENAKYYESFNVQGLDTFSAANFVASLKNRKLIVDGKTIQLVKDIEDQDYTNIEFNEFDANNRIGQISRDNNLFDFYNQITVYGDGVKTTVRDSKSIKKDGLKELEEVDLTIVTEEACKRKAMSLLKIHSESSAAISFKVLYDQCPYLRPGQIVTINYPSEKIPRGDYIVLEINYSIGGYMDVKVGKYAKNLTNRIAELLVQGKKVDAALRGDRYKTTTPSSFIQEEVALRAVKLKVQYTTSSSVAANVFGFTPVFGFDSTLGIMVPTGESTQNLEYDLL